MRGWFFMAHHRMYADKVLRQQRREFVGNPARIQFFNVSEFHTGTLTADLAVASANNCDPGVLPTAGGRARGGQISGMPDSASLSRRR